MRWRLIVEEFNSELIYIKGQNNIIADALSRLDIKPLDSTQDTPTAESLASVYALDDNDLPVDAFPVTYSTIMKHQQKDKNLLKLFKSSKLKFKDFHGGGKTFKLIVNNENKIRLPKTLQIRTVEWYHNVLCHPGETRTELTIKQHFT